MTKGELVKMLDKFDDDTRIAIFSKNEDEAGNIQCHPIYAIHDLWPLKEERDTIAIEVELTVGYNPELHDNEEDVKKFWVEWHESLAKEIEEGIYDRNRE